MGRNPGAEVGNGKTKQSRRPLEQKRKMQTKGGGGGRQAKRTTPKRGTNNAKRKAKRGSVVLQDRS